MVGRNSIVRTRGRTAGLVTAVAALAVAAALAGCGAESYENEPKPAMTKTISVFVGEDRIAFSPREPGAGPARFVMTNQTGVDQTITVASDRDEFSIRIAPNQTAKRKTVLVPGYLSLSADKTAADAIETTVGPERPSAQQDLDQP